MYDQFDDGRGLYPDTIRAKAPLGMRKTIQRAAAIEGVGAGEFIRRALRNRVEAVIPSSASHPTEIAPSRSELKNAG